MQAWEAIILGIIEGITEYLPVSSTGHLVVAERLMGIGNQSPMDKIAADTFAVCIQGGAILAVLGLYFSKVWQMGQGCLGRNPAGLKLAMNLVVAFLPAVFFGLLFNDWIESKLFDIQPIIAAWIVGGIAMIGVSRWHYSRRGSQSGGSIMDMTWKMALCIGLLQCIAMWPGTSRSLMTILGGLLVGLSVASAVEFSFLLGVLTLGAATVKKAVEKIDGIHGYDHIFGGTRLILDHYGTTSIALAFIAAAISAALSVKWLVGYLQSHSLSGFGWYRIILGCTVGAMLYFEYV